MKTKINIFFTLLVAVVALGFNSCKENPYKYEIAKGQPTVYYVRMPDAAAADSLITGAYMGNFVVLIGENLRSTVAIEFNDQAAYLNTSLITDNTLFVQIPSNIPDKVENKIFLHAENGATVEYPFSVLVPGPSISAISNEFAAPGMKATIYGDYFLTTDTDPFVLTLPDGTALSADQVDLSKMAVTFTVPESYTGEQGAISIRTIYGNASSSFLFHDVRNVILDFDAEAPHDHGGYDAGNGWRGSISRCDGAEVVPALDGNFLWLGGTMKEEGDWADDPFEFDAWRSDDGSYDLSTLPGMADMLANYELADLTLKFELFVPKANAWSAGALQMIWMGEVNASNSPHSTNTYPRGIYNPWAATGSYYTEDWTTVSMPLKDFVYGPQAAPASDALTKDMLKGLTIFVFQGGMKGTECEPHFAIDNVRVVPN